MVGVKNKVTNPRNNGGATVNAGDGFAPPEGGAALYAHVACALPDFTVEVELTVAEAEVLVLVGPSGCGKTTTLNMIAGLVRPQRGCIRTGEFLIFDAKEGIDAPVEHRRIGYVFQDYALFPHLTVEQNVAYGVRAHGVRKGNLRRRVDEMLQRFGIESLRRRRPATLSGGERQRVALARAMAVNPRVLLLDEPLAALDATARRTVRRDLRQFLRQFKIPTVLVTHDYEDALAFGDRIAVMNRGAVVQQGVREDMLLHPRSPFVAGFTGVNYFEGAAVRKDGELCAVRIGDALVYAVTDARGEVGVSFFPSDVVLSLEPPHGSARNVFCGPVREIVDLGARVRVYVRTALPIVAELTRDAAATLDLAEGRVVYASFKATAVRVAS